MFELGASELLLIAVVALLVIGPKELPNALRVVGRYMGKARAMTRHLRAGFDEMIRQSEMEEMEKQWRDHNRKIMEAHPTNDHSFTGMHDPANVAASAATPLPPVVPTVPVTATDASKAPASPSETPTAESSSADGDTAPVNADVGAPSATSAPDVAPTAKPDTAPADTSPQRPPA